MSPRAGHGRPLHAAVTFDFGRRESRAGNAARLLRSRRLYQENLSDLEAQVLRSYLEGKTYQEMARDLNRRTKSIDNALQRVKRKIEKNLAEIEVT